MKNWFKRNGGYVYTGLCLILGITGFGTLLVSSGLIESFLCILAGTIGLTLCGFSALDQHDKNKESMIISTRDLKFEDKTDEDYSKVNKIENNVKYTKNFIIEENKEKLNNKNDDLNI